MGLVSGIFKAFFGPKRSPWITLIDATIDPGEQTTRIVVTLTHDMAAEWNKNITGAPVLIPDPLELILGDHRVQATDWKGSGDVALDAIGAYPASYDPTGDVMWGQPFDFVFDVPLDVASGRLDVRVHYIQRGRHVNSEWFPLLLP